MSDPLTGTKPPDVIAGKYEVIEVIGRGGMGTVYKALQRNLDRVVAVKMLSEELASDTEFRARFQQEATLIARLHHPNIIQVYDIEPHNHTFCIIMEFLEGESLQGRLDRDIVVAERDIISIGVQVSRALHHAHAHGIIHRDIKPDNIHISPQGLVKVMDFGIARYSQSKLKTQTGISMGTPKFMSPEQVTGKNIDGQSDLYSLGVCLYACLAGRVPFDGENAISIATKHLYEQPVPPSQINTSVSSVLEKVVMKAIEKNKQVRWGSGEELAVALEGTQGNRRQVYLAEESAGETVSAGVTQRMNTTPIGGSAPQTPGKQRTPTGLRKLVTSREDPSVEPLKSPHDIPSLDFEYTPPPENFASNPGWKRVAWFTGAAVLIAGAGISVGVILRGNNAVDPIDDPPSVVAPVVPTAEPSFTQGDLVKQITALEDEISRMPQQAASTTQSTALKSLQRTYFMKRRERLSNDNKGALVYAYGMALTQAGGFAPMQDQLKRKMSEPKGDTTSDVGKAEAAVSREPGNLQNWIQLGRTYKANGMQPDANVVVQYLKADATTATAGEELLKSM